MSAQPNMTELQICKYQRRYCLEQSRRHQSSNPLYSRDWLIEARRWHKHVLNEKRHERYATCSL